MVCAVHATYDGDACEGALLRRIERHIEAFEAACRPLRSCRVRIRTRCTHRADRCALSVWLQMKPTRGAGLEPISSTAKQDAVAAVDEAFATAFEQGGVVRSPAARRRSTSGHIVAVSTSTRAGVLKTDEGAVLEFMLSGPERGSTEPLHVGDRAWITPSLVEGVSQTLVCARRGRIIPVSVSVLELALAAPAPIRSLATPSEASTQSGSSAAQAAK